MDKTPIKNYGLLEGFRRTDYYANAMVGALPYKEVLPSGDWKQYLPPGEWQASDRGDSMSCVTFSALNAIETQEFFLTGKRVNYSDRFIAKMSDTTRQGNYLWKVAETIRKYGLVLEEDYPAPKSYTWDEYHAEIPEPLFSELIAKGKKWLEKWDVSYEEVATDKASLIKHSKHAPLQVTIPGHAIEEYKTDLNRVYYFDSYSPYMKEIANINWGQKVLLTPRPEAPSPEMLLVNIEYLESGRQVEKLRHALIRNGWDFHQKDINNPETHVSNWPNVYDLRLAERVFEYQKGNLPKLSWSYFWAVWWYKGKLVDEETRKQLNKGL